MLAPDVPIKSRTEDKLNRRYFADDLCKAVKNYKREEALTIGVYGKWGSGKTSVLNMVHEALNGGYQSNTPNERNDNQQKIILMKFDPWLYSSPEQLISCFLKQLSKEVGIHDGMRELRKSIEQYGDMITALCGISALGNFGKILQFGNRIIAATIKNGKQESTLQSLKESISKEIKKRNVRIIAMIDDIDRLGNDEICGVFRMIKAVADFPKMIYLLAFDYEIIVKALNEVQEGNGEAYLEKIINVPFSLPEHNASRVRESFVERLREAAVWSDEGIQKRTDVDDVIEIVYQYIKTFRDANRFLNVFGFKSAAIGQDTNTTDLIAITCIQVFEPKVFLEIYKRKIYLVGSPVLNESVTAKVNALIKLAENKEACSYLLMFLFPKANAVLANEFSGRYVSTCVEILASAERRMASPDYFDRYFTMMLEDDEISAAELDLLYESNISVGDIFDNIICEKKCRSTLKRLSLPSKEKNVLVQDRKERIVSISMELLGKFNQLVTENINGNGEMIYEAEWNDCILEFLSLIDKDNRRIVFDQARFAGRLSSTVLWLLLNGVRALNGAGFEQDEISWLETLFINKIKEEIDNKIFLNTEHACLKMNLLEQLDRELYESLRAVLCSEKSPQGLSNHLCDTIEI